MVAAGRGSTGSYRRLLAEPGLRRLAVADVCARLPQGMLGIVVLLVVAQHAAMAVAGFALAGYTLGQGVTGPLRGRLADRCGLFMVAVVCGAAWGCGLAGLLACSLLHGPAWLLVAGATVAGLCNPPLSPGMRSLWALYAGPALRHTAFALDAAVFDLAFITGPVIASALATGVAPAAALGLLLALTAAAILLVRAPARPGRTAPGTPEPATQVPATPAPGRPLRSAALRRLLVTAALTNAALSTTEVALTAYARHHHALWASGPLLAGISAGSIAGSLLLGARGAGGGARRLPRLLAGYTLGLTALAAAGLYAPLLAVAAPLAGLCLGPTLATLFASAAAASPRGAATEAQSWLNSIMNGGAAAGAALAGFTAGRPELGLALAAAIAAVAAVAAFATRRPDLAARPQPVDAGRVARHHRPGAGRPELAHQQGAGQRRHFGVARRQRADRPVRAEYQPRRPETVDQVVRERADRGRRPAGPGFRDQPGELADQVLAPGQPGDQARPRFEVARRDIRLAAVVEHESDLGQLPDTPQGGG